MLVDREFKDCSAPSQLIGTGQEAIQMQIMLLGLPQERRALISAYFIAQQHEAICL